MKYSEWLVPGEAVAIPPRLALAGCPPLLAALLHRRGIDTPEEAASFLSGGEELLGDPMHLADMGKAVERVRAAIKNKETVAVFGDYDVDGITSSCVVAGYLEARGVRCIPYIPDRIEEGYGLNMAAIGRIAERGATLIITVDCGITAVEEAACAKSLGMDMIITDHHECGAAALPDACAVVDPKRPDCPYPNKELAGVGVAFKLLCAVDGDSRRVLSEYADLVAIGTVADVMSLTGENRYIVKRGLRMLSASARPGIRALLSEAGAAEKQMNAGMIGFTLAPRINAAGRLGKADVAVRLLMTGDPAEASVLAAELCRLNRERQALEQDIWKEARAILEKNPPTAPIVLVGENWHQGVIGIAASKLADEYALPAVMICLDGETGKGSCRSCAGFNLFDALSACSDCLVSFGGHTLAAGLTIRRDRVDDFRAALKEYYYRNPASAAPALECDVRIDDPGLLSVDGVTALEQMEPYGAGNPRPTFYMSDLLLTGVTPIGGGKHLKMTLKKGGASFDCVLFSRTAEDLCVSGGDRVDAAFYPKINTFRGRRSLQLLLTDLRPADTLSICRTLLDGRTPNPWEAAELCPSRADFVTVWHWLGKNGGSVNLPVEELEARAPSGMRGARLIVCLKIMESERLTALRWDGKVYRARTLERAGKADLDSSRLWREFRDCRDRYL